MRISDWSSDVCSSYLTEPPHHLLVAKSDRLRSHACLDTHAGGRRQIRRCLERHAARLGTFDDRMGKRMLAPCFDCSDFAEKIRFINATARGHRDEVRLTHGESTRLVDHQRVDLFERLQSLGVRSEEHTSELQYLMRHSYA